VADDERRWPPWPNQTSEPDDDEDAVEYAWENYRTRGDYDELHRAIDVMDDRLRAIPEDDDRWPGAADRLAALLSARFRHAGREEDLERALPLSRAAVERGGRRPLFRVREAEARGLRYVAHGHMADLEAALVEAREACLERVADADERFLMAESFAELLVLAYRATGDRDRLDDALAVIDAVGPDMQTQAGHISVRLAGSASAVSLHLFQETGIREYVEWAVKWSSWAVDATPAGAAEYARRLRDLGVALTTSYEVSDDESELERAFVALEDARARTHEAAPERASMEFALLSVPIHRLSRARLLPLLDGAGFDRERLEGMEQVGLPPEGVVVARLASVGEGLLHRLPQGSSTRPEVLSLLATLYREQFNVAKGVDRTRAAADGLQIAAGPDRLLTAANVAGVAAREWAAMFANATVAQKLGASRSIAQLYAFAVDASLELARLADTPELADSSVGVRTAADGTVHLAPRVSVADAHGRAFLMAETAKAQLLTEQLSRDDLTAPPKVPRWLLARERALIEELTEIDTAAIAARGTGVPAEMDSERRGRLVAELDEVWTSIGGRGDPAAEYVSLRRKETPDLMSIGEVVMAEPEDTVVLSLYVLESRTALFSAPSDGSGYAVDELPIGAKVWAEALRRFARELPRSDGRDLVSATWERPLRPLLKKAAERTAGCSRVVLAPHGAAGALPWTFLVRDWETRSGGPPAISIVPSLTALRRLQKRAPPRTRQAVVIGNPTGDLPHAELEAREVASVLGVEPILGAAADAAAMNAAAPDARILHLAAHAAFDSDSPSDSYVLLSDGQWSARDALRCQIDAELVILSGCETGSLGSLAGDELMGMAYAFLHAGARAVIVSLWPISDAVTAKFMKTFHRLYGKGTSPSEALSLAAREVRRTHEHPWYWAAFSLIGDG
jgi:CHAT domain-containing protein